MTTNTPTTDRSDFQATLVELRRIRDEVGDVKRWFRDHSKIPHYLFRLSGTLVILLSVSLPFASVIDSAWVAKIVVPVLSLCIAALTGLSAFYNWQLQWQNNRQTQFALEHLLRHWELGILAAEHESDPEKRVVSAIRCTEELLRDARNVTAAATTEYFESIRLPHPAEASATASKGSHNESNNTDL